MLKGKQKKLDKNKDGKISGEDFKMMKAKIGKIAAEEKYSTVEFGKTYHPITQSQMSNNIRKNFEGDKKFASSNELDDAHEKLKKNLSDKNVRPSEILKLDKEYKARKERAIKTVQKDLSSRPEMKELRKKTKGTVTDTGSTYSKGGAARTSGMGLQDEKVKPGKVQKVFLGKMIKGAGKSIGRLFGAKKSATATPGTVTMSKSGIGGEGGMLPQLLQKAIDEGKVKKASLGLMFKKAKDKGAKGAEFLSPLAMLKRISGKKKGGVAKGEMMKAKYGKMMKAEKGGGADMGKKDYKIGLEMQGDYKGKDIKGKAKEFISTALKQNKGSISKVLKKLAGSQVSDKEAKEIKKLLPSAAKKGKMMKAKSGKMIEANIGMEAKSNQGYGAARTSGMGLQDENLIPGKSLDYYKDIM
jgi:uncharacterized protein YlbG (UPF0298 family)